MAIPLDIDINALNDSMHYLFFITSIMLTLKLHNIKQILLNLNILSFCEMHFFLFGYKKQNYHYPQTIQINTEEKKNREKKMSRICRFLFSEVETI